MRLDFSNVNTLWCSVIVETLVTLGLKNAVICPGSRSTPLTVAFAKHSQVDTIPILDERSAAFFALGKAKRTNLPVVLICSSGTAGANFYPAVIEAKETGVSLIILTADRPPELRNCHAGQTIDQIELYGNYPNWYVELALPEANREMLCYLRQNIVRAWEKSQLFSRGVVHLNCPFREPLAPVVNRNTLALKDELNESTFFNHIQPENSTLNFTIKDNSLSCDLTKKGIIIAGLAQPDNPEKYCQQIALLSQKLQFPVLAEALSPLRNYARLNPYLIATYDTILRQYNIAKVLAPEVIIQLGELPTSKQLRKWLSELNVTRYIITNSQENFDPLHKNTVHITTSLANFSEVIQQPKHTEKKQKYLRDWQTREIKLQKAIANKLASLDILYEGKVAWLISQHLPTETPIFFANSMTVRNAEFFWQLNNSKVVPYFNRGANGIDGTLSTALGIAYRDRPTVILTGDLALLHDTNGFLIEQHFVGHLTIILINNHGGGIFEMLPISRFEPPFEKYFATPQNIDIAKLCQAYDIEYQAIDNWQQLITLLNPLPTEGIRILELKTDRKHDANWLQENIWQLKIIN